MDWAWGNPKHGRCKFSILVIYFRCFGTKGKSADQTRERLMDWYKKIRDTLAVVPRDFLMRSYESRFFNLQKDVQNAEAKAELRHKILVYSN